MRDYLEFEKPIREIEEKIEKLAAAPTGKSTPQDEIRKLRMKLAQVEQALYGICIFREAFNADRPPGVPTGNDVKILCHERYHGAAPSGGGSA